MSDPEAHALRAAVATTSKSSANFERAISTNVMTAHMDAFIELAKTLESAGCKSEVQQVRAAVQSSIRVDAGILRHAAAVQSVAQHYEPVCTYTQTDFQSDIERHMAAYAEGGAEDERLVAFDAAVRGAGGGEASELEDDEELRIDEASGSLAPNFRCPISQKLVMELEEPVEDVKGFVYEKADMVSFMKGGTIQCPVSGTNHTVNAAGLQPARAILRAQSQARRNVGRSTAHGQRAGEAVLDVE